MVAAVTITILMFSLSLAIAFAQEQLIQTIRAQVVVIKKWSGGVLILVGLWLIVLGIWAQAFARVFPV